MRVVRLVVISLTAALVLGLVAVVLTSSDDPTPASRMARRSGAPNVRVSERWRVALPFEWVGLPATDRAGVIVTAGESQVVAISPAGTVEWTTALEGATAAPPRIDDDLVFVAAQRAVVALRRDTGSPVWSVATTDTADANRANRPAVAGDVVVATAADGLVLGLDRATGAQRWRTSLLTATTADPSAGGGAAVPPVVVVVGIGAWHGFDVATGTPLWSADLGLFGTSSPVVYARGAESMAAVASNERVVAVDGRTGALRWSAPAEQSELYQTPVIAANGNELLVPDHWGRLTAYHPQDGRRFWSVAGSDSVAEFGQPVLLRDQLVALPLDADGPRLGSPKGSIPLDTPSDGHGVAELPDRGLVVTTWGGTPNYVLLYRVR